MVLRGSASLESFAAVAIASTAPLSRVRILDDQPYFLAADGGLWEPAQAGFTPVPIASAPLTDLIQIEPGELLITCEDGCIYRRDQAGDPFRNLHVNQVGSLDAIARN